MKQNQISIIVIYNRYIYNFATFWQGTLEEAQNYYIGQKFTGPAREIISVELFDEMYEENLKQKSYAV
jgi:hypothetical protein